MEGSIFPSIGFQLYPSMKQENTILLSALPSRSLDEDNLSTVLDRLAPTTEHRKTAVNGLATLGRFSLGCSQMLNDIIENVKPPLTAN